MSASRWKAAVECFESVTKLAPQVDVGYFNLGNAYFELRRFDAAEKAYKSAISLSPDADAWNNLGNTFSELMRFEEAISAYRSAMNFADSISRGSVQTHLNLAKALLSVGQYSAAAETLMVARSYQPNHAGVVELYLQSLAMMANVTNGASSGAGVSLKEGGPINSLNAQEEAMRVWEAAIESPQSKIAACFGMSFFCELSGQWDQSLSYLVQAIDWFPDDATVFAKMGSHHARRGNVSEATACIHRAATLTKPTANLFSHWVQNLQSTSVNTVAKILDEARQWNQIPNVRLANSWDDTTDIGSQTVCSTGDVDSGKLTSCGKPVIAILASSDAISAVHLQLLPYLANRNAEEFRVDVYWNSLNDSGVPDSVKRSADNWISCHQSSDESLARRIRFEKTSAVIDMIGHGPNTRLGVAKLMPAPKYALWNYAQQTTGAGEVGYRITMALDPAYMKVRSATEETVLTKFPRLKSGKALRSDVESSDELEGRSNAILFGFAGQMKWVTHESIEFWSRLLLANNEASFCFASHDFQDEVLQKEVCESFVRKGVAAERILFNPVTSIFSEDELRHWIASIDVYAESIPTPSMTGTLTAINLGCVVVGVAGDSSPRALLYPIVEGFDDTLVYEKTIQETVDALRLLLSNRSLVRSSGDSDCRTLEMEANKDYALSVESAWKRILRDGKRTVVDETASNSIESKVV